MDFGIVGFVFMPYFVPFIIAICMPNRWALLGAALLLGSPLTWMVISYGRWADHAHGGAILDAVFGVAYYGAAWLGLFAGVATRAILFLTRKRVTGYRSRSCIIFSGFILAPTCFLTFMTWEEWPRRMPSESCINTKHRIEINGALFDLPSAPFFHLWISPQKIYFLGFTTNLREFCELAASTDKPVHTVNFTSVRLKVE
ncbi:hypothetical protein ACO0K9_27810 [Undibacterium sp. Ji50W]|uniref:hypothetical protein n=1 Tax=Undibacterium sp. Ji50W TaxID=3413041 RepID=UPI003BF350EE